MQQIKINLGQKVYGSQRMWDPINNREYDKRYYGIVVGLNCLGDFITVLWEQGNVQRVPLSNFNV